MGGGFARADQPGLGGGGIIGEGGVEEGFGVGRLDGAVDDCAAAGGFEFDDGLEPGEAEGADAAEADAARFGGGLERLPEQVGAGGDGGGGEVDAEQGAFGRADGRGLFERGFAEVLEGAAHAGLPSAAGSSRPCSAP